MRGEGVKIDLGAKLLRLDLELYGAEQKKKTTYLVCIYSILWAKPAQQSKLLGHKHLLKSNYYFFKYIIIPYNNLDSIEILKKKSKDFLDISK